MLFEAQLPNFSDLAITVFPRLGSSYVVFILFNPSKLLNAFNDTKIQELILSQKSSKPVEALINYSNAFIGIIIVDSDNPEQPCMNAKEVSFSAVASRYQGKGYGKLLYLAAMQRFGVPLMSDRESVSPDAARVWGSFDKDPSIGKLPPDKEPFLGHFDNFESPKTEPHEDDCKLQDLPVLNKAYYSKGSIFTTLHNNYQNFANHVKKLGGARLRMFQFFKSKSNAIASNIFQKEYAKGAGKI